MPPFNIEGSYKSPVLPLGHWDTGTLVVSSCLCFISLQGLFAVQCQLAVLERAVTQFLQLAAWQADLGWVTLVQQAVQTATALQAHQLSLTSIMNQRTGQSVLTGYQSFYISPFLVPPDPVSGPGRPPQCYVNWKMIPLVLSPAALHS